MSAGSAVERRHHRELQPIKTLPENSCESQRLSRRSSTTSTNCWTPLPSPSIVAARAYHIETTTPIDAQQRHKSLTEVQDLPRRHSLLATTKKLAVQLESFRFSRGCHGLTPVAEIEEPLTKFKLEGSSDVSIKEIRSSGGMPAPGTNADVPCGTPQEVLRQVPFQYTHNHLRDWGYAYLGNSATADAFVNAVSLRRPSMAAANDNGSNTKLKTHLTTIRARVVPRGKGRKPFLIQRQFDIEELRRSIPEIPSQPGEVEGSPILRRSPRTRRSSAQATTGSSPQENSNIKRKHAPPSPGKGPLPIHIEYALHYLPVLGALMLSGHVRKGDSIDLPIPHPEAWWDVLTYIYTGRGSHGRITIAMKENILFLAGHA